MKNVLGVIALVLILTGCNYVPDKIEGNGPDQCLRADLFKQCMASIPQSPQVVGKDSQWADVVGNCASSAYYQSLRSNKHIKPECKAS